MKQLSPKQQRIMEYIHQFVADNGYPPTVRDIQSGCEISSTSVVDYHLKVLEKTGYLRRHREVSRGLKIMDRSPSGMLEVPIIGEIAAGEPIPVPGSDVWDMTASADTLQVAESLAHGKQDIYALRVKGTSMIDALINDGDIVLMEYVKTVENGEMAAVWLKAEKEVTLKKVYAGPESVRLQPANAKMRPIYVKPDNVEIQGRVIAVIRRLA